MRFRIDLKILIFFVLFYFTNQLSVYLWTILFCFIHEIGHLIVGLLMGERPDKIEMTPFGFFMSFMPNTERSNKESIRANILIALAGPLTNLILIFIFLGLHISFIGRDIAVYINLIIFGFNLFPIYPLDGGRVLESILEIKYGITKANIYINKISNIYIILLTMVSSIALYYFKNISILLIIGYLWLLVLKENRNFKMKQEALNFTKK